MEIALPLPPPVYTYEFNHKIPRPCCLNDIIVQNISLPGTELIDYVAKNTVSTQGNVTIESNADVLFQAGQRVTLNPGFKTEPGAKFVALVDGCSMEPIRLSISEDDLTEVENDQTFFSNPPPRDQVTSIENTTSEEYFKVYPNPSTGQVNLEWNINNLSQENGEVYFRDIIGNVVYSKKIYQDQSKASEKIDLSHLAKGMYVIQAVFGEKVFVRNLILQ